MVRSFQRRVKQVPWQLTDQTCELLEGIRCADSLAMIYVLDLGKKRERGTGCFSSVRGTDTVSGDR